MLLSPDTMKPKKKSRIDREIWVRKARLFERMKPSAEATQTARKEIGDRLLYSLSDK
jgi:hypothetical protein